MHENRQGKWLREFPITSMHFVELLLEIFRQIVDAYLVSGAPVGSRTLSKGGLGLSPASIRNVMSDLTELGLIDRVRFHHVLVDGGLKLADVAIATAVEVDDRIFDGDELDPVAIGDGDSNRNPGIFDNLLLHNDIPRPCARHGVV